MYIEPAKIQDLVIVNPQILKKKKKIHFNNLEYVAPLNAELLTIIHLMTL